MKATRYFSCQIPSPCNYSVHFLLDRQISLTHCTTTSKAGKGKVIERSANSLAAVVLMDISKTSHRISLTDVVCGTWVPAAVTVRDRSNTSEGYLQMMKGLEACFKACALKSRKGAGFLVHPNSKNNSHPKLVQVGLLAHYCARFSYHKTLGKGKTEETMKVKVLTRF